MTRITVDVNDGWLEAAREVLGTQTKVATINAALPSFAIRRQAVDIVAPSTVSTWISVTPATRGDTAAGAT